MTGTSSVLLTSLDGYKIVFPTKKQRYNETYKVVNRVWYKKCTGPAHAYEVEHGLFEINRGFAWLPATEKYFYAHKNGKNAGKLTSRCRLCTNWDKVKSPGSYHGYVDRSVALPFFTEAVNRIGVIELSKRSKVSRGAIERLLNGESARVRKLTLRKIMLELVSLRRKGESSTSLALRWRNDRRNNAELGTCGGCGGTLRNWTFRCERCNDRWYQWLRRDQITQEEYDSARPEKMEK